MTPGIKTTEFWATMVFHAAAVALIVLKDVSAEWAVAAMGAAQIAYNWSRGYVKAGTTTKTAARK